MEGEKKQPKILNLFDCKTCNYTTSKVNDYNKHLLTLKHKTRENGEVLENKYRKIYHYCEFCSITTYKQCDYNKHILTSKHKNNEKNCKDKDYNKNKCDKCDKTYSSLSNLWKHKKKCIVINNKDAEIHSTMHNTTITPDLFMEVLKQSKELQNVLIEQNKELQNKLLEKEGELQNKLLEKEGELYNKLMEQNTEHHKQLLQLASKQTNNTINSNNTNNQFNLQFYLNETCKDAMNIVDFVNSLTLTTEDFETTGKLGFVEGISRIFIKALKQMEKEKLPIHCTDLKRETVYIKDKNIWEKENDDKRKLKWTIDRIAQLNLNQNQNWLEKYPVCKENNTKENEKFTAMALVALGGRGEEEDNKFREKIMRNVLKEVVLDKQYKVLN